MKVPIRRLDLGVMTVPNEQGFPQTYVVEQAQIGASGYWRIHCGCFPSTAEAWEWIEAIAEVPK